MVIQRNYTIKKLRELGEALGRDGVAIEIQKCVEEYDGSYKGALELAGRLFVMAEMSTFDRYWEEKMIKGVQRQTYICCELMRGLKP